jgi:hypothetical protein
MRLIIKTSSVRFSVSHGVDGATCLLREEVKGSIYDSTDYEFNVVVFGAIYSLAVLCNYCNVTTWHDPLPSRIQSIQMGKKKGNKRE